MVTFLDLQRLYRPKAAVLRPRVTKEAYGNATNKDSGKFHVRYSEAGMGLS
jgi:hypothetical protein